MMISCRIGGGFEQLRRRFSPYAEVERHSVWHVCMKPYTSRRQGIHAYIGADRIHGYYESGEENRNGRLLTAKSWFYLSAKSEADMLRVRCLVLPEPIMLLFYWMALIASGLYFALCPGMVSMIEFLVGGGMVLVLLIKQIGETTVLQNSLLRILSETTASDTPPQP